MNDRAYRTVKASAEPSSAVSHRIVQCLLAHELMVEVEEVARPLFGSPVYLPKARAADGEARVFSSLSR